MTVLEVSRARRRTRRRMLPRVAIGVLAVVAVASLVTAALAGRFLLHRGEVMPGVQVLGVDLGGLDPAAAATAIEDTVGSRLKEPVQIAVRSRQARVSPETLVRADVEATVAAALAAGRDGWGPRLRSLLAPLTRPLEVEPRIEARPEARERLRELLGAFAKPGVPAKVEMKGLRPVVTPAKPGVRPDIRALVRQLERRASSPASGAPVRVTFRRTVPAIDDADARRAAKEARLVVSAPVRLRVGKQRAGRLSRGQLAELLVFRRHEGRLLVALDEERLTAALEPLAAPFGRRPVNASFAVDGTRARVVPSKSGIGLGPRRSLDAVVTAAHRDDDRTARLRLRTVPAPLTTADAKALGIRRRISSFTTDMGVSSANRIHNVHLMADYIDGTIVRPGEAFSFNERVGPRSEERGFLEGQMIVGSLLLPSIGGGVCQTATTLFNNAFELGLPILERHNHSFYISHYPVGRDATVAWGGPDFQFRNDLPHAILIKASYTSSTLTFTFYGTPPRRKVVARTSEKTNVKEPGKTYALDPAAPRGSVRLVTGSHQQGFDVTVYRTVQERGKTIREDSFTSRYIPVGDTEIYGPGRSIPGPYFVIPTT